MSDSKSMLEKFLGLFSEVRPGEGTTALLLTLISFLILTSYYVLKPVREALILSDVGPEAKTYASVGQALLLVVTVQIYSWLGAHLGRRALINWVTLFFVACLVGFYILGKAQVRLGLVFFLWVGIFNLVAVSQFWSFANDLYTVERGQRLFPIVAFGSSSGAVFGSFLADRLFGPGGFRARNISAPSRSRAVPGRRRRMSWLRVPHQRESRLLEPASKRSKR